MTFEPKAALRDPVFGDLGLNWKWMLTLGILIGLLGIVGLGMTYWLTVFSVLWLGVLTIVGGVAQVVQAFKSTGWRSVLAHVLVGLLYIGVGVVLVALPVQSAWWLTLFIGAMFVVVGLLRLVMAFQARGNGSAAIWLALSGVISLALGVLIYSIVSLPTADQLATAGAAQGWFTEWGWVIGLFVAVEFIAHGASLIALALTARDRHQRFGPGGGSTTAA